MGCPRIGKELQKQHIIGSSFAFNIYARLNGDNSFQAGTYELHENLGVKDAVKALKAGPEDRLPPAPGPARPVAPGGREPASASSRQRTAQTFLAGTRNNAVRSSFEPAGVSNLEGLLRPDTYKVSASQDELGILQAMVTEFDKNAQKLGLSTANVDGHGAYDIIKVASLIESEAKVPQDRPLIASVIYNRLAANMPLQIDSTVIYARGKPGDRSLSASDLQDIKSPYNTYLHNGLPPTPIGGVSDASLQAAMAPAQTDYLYYVLAGKGRPPRVLVDVRGQQQNIAEAQRLGLL